MDERSSTTQGSNLNDELWAVLRSGNEYEQINAVRHPTLSDEQKDFIIDTCSSFVVLHLLDRKDLSQHQIDKLMKTRLFAINAKTIRLFTTHQLAEYIDSIHDLSEYNLVLAEAMLNENFTSELIDRILSYEQYHARIIMSKNVSSEQLFYILLRTKNTFMQDLILSHKNLRSEHKILYQLHK